MRRISRYWMLFQIFMHRDGYRRAEFLKRRSYFKLQGKHCYLQPWNFGTEPNMISFGDNVHVASKVTFINHDITALMFRYMDKKDHISERKGEIKIGNNVFIGTNTTILYDVEIGDNVIIGAGSLVCKSIPSGVVAAGNPCVAIGKFDDYKSKILNSVF